MIDKTSFQLKKGNFAKIENVNNMPTDITGSNLTGTKSKRIICMYKNNKK